MGACYFALVASAALRPYIYEILQARVLEWLSMPSSRGSSGPRDGTHVSCGSCIAGRFFTSEPLGKPIVQETRVLSLDWEDPLENGMATHSCILAWESPRTEESGGLLSTGLQKSWPQLSN